MSNRKYVDGMLVGTGMLVAGVAFLLWLSTLGNNDIETKMAFYGTTAGHIVGFVLLVAPFVVLSQKVMKDDLSRKGLAISFLIMVMVQLIIAAYIPFIVELYREAGSGIGNAVIKAKG